MNRLTNHGATAIAFPSGAFLAPGGTATVSNADWEDPTTQAAFARGALGLHIGHRAIRDEEPGRMQFADALPSVAGDALSGLQRALMRVG